MFSKSYQVLPMLLIPNSNLHQDLLLVLIRNAKVMPKLRLNDNTYTNDYNDHNNDNNNDLIYGVPDSLKIRQLLYHE